MIRRKSIALLIGSLAMINGGYSMLYQYDDGMGNTVLINDGAAITHLYQYSAYGMQSDLMNSASVNDPDDRRQGLDIADNQNGYRAQRQDPGTMLGMMGNGYRAYDPAVGQFMKADSLTSFSGKQTNNSMGYVSGNPVFYSDPSGHFKMPSWANYALNSVGIAGGVGMLAAAQSPFAAISAGLGIASGILGIGAELASSNSHLHHLQKQLTIGSTVAGGLSLGMAMLSVVASKTADIVTRLDFQLNEGNWNEINDVTIRANPEQFAADKNRMGTLNQTIDELPSQVQPYIHQEGQAIPWSDFQLGREPLESSLKRFGLLTEQQGLVFFTNNATSDYAAEYDAGTKRFRLWTSKPFTANFFIQESNNDLRLIATRNWDFELRFTPLSDYPDLSSMNMGSRWMISKT
ncbi:MAG: RHS repeat-associated core domain-containing protein [Francisellaceae bacterium]